MYVAAFGDKRGVFKCENLKKANVPSRLGSDGSLYEVEYTVALIPILLLAPEEESIYGLRDLWVLMVRGWLFQVRYTVNVGHSPAQDDAIPWRTSGNFPELR